MTCVKSFEGLIAALAFFQLLCLSACCAAAAVAAIILFFRAVRYEKMFVTFFFLRLYIGFTVFEFFFHSRVS